MSSQALLGLLLQINADPSNAQATINEFTAKAGSNLEGFGKAGAKAGEEVEKGLINSHQSVHLLAEEMGIHLPRAVVGAVAEMLPQINMLGGALLGVFAVREVIEFGKELDELDKEAEGTTRAIKLMTEAIKENNKVIQDGARASKEEAEKQLIDVNKRIGLEEVSAAQLRRRYDDDRQILGYIGTGLDKIFGWTGKLNEAEEQLAADQEMRDELLKVLNEDNIEAKKKAKEEAEKAAKAEVQRAREVNAAEAKLLQTRVQLNAELRKMVEEGAEGRQRDAASKQFQDQLNLNTALQTFNGELERNNALVRSAAPHLITYAHAISDVSERTVYWNHLTDQAKAIHYGFLYAINDEIKAIRQDYAGTIESLSAGIAGMIGGTKAAARVQGAWDVAKSIECWAKFIESWGTDVPAGLAAVKYDLAAAEMFKTAGGGGGRSSGGAGGGAAGRVGGGDRGARGDHSNLPPPQTLAGGAAAAGGRYSTVHVMVMGDNEAAGWMAGVLTAGVERGGVSLTATTAQRGSPVGH